VASLNDAMLAEFARLDASSDGSFTTSGWCFDDDGTAISIAAAIDGRIVTTIDIDQDRPDVAAAYPSLSQPTVGWQDEVDFRGLPAGIHRLELLALEEGRRPVRLGRRILIVVDPLIDNPPPTAEVPVDADDLSSRPGLHAAIDDPTEPTTLYFPGGTPDHGTSP
jgi:hypothetical protein